MPAGAITARKAMQPSSPALLQLRSRERNLGALDRPAASAAPTERVCVCDKESDMMSETERVRGRAIKCVMEDARWRAQEEDAKR